MIRLSAAVFATAIRLLFCTLRLRVDAVPGTSPYSTPGDADRFLYCVWHDSMLIAAFGGNHACTTALTSRHSDGSFVAEVLKWKRVPTIRGSTNRISTGTIRALVAEVASRHLVMTPDGPRGPARRMSVGIAYLASRAGTAIVPTGFACSSCWRIRGSWSDLLIPKPFARTVLLTGEPIEVPPELKPVALHDWVAVIQAAMDQLDDEAADMLLPAETFGFNARRDAAVKAHHAEREGASWRSGPDCTRDAVEETP